MPTRPLGRRWRRVVPDDAVARRLWRFNRIPAAGLVGLGALAAGLATRLDVLACGLVAGAVGAGWLAFDRDQAFYVSARGIRVGGPTGTQVGWGDVVGVRLERVPVGPVSTRSAGASVGIELPVGELRHLVVDRDSGPTTLVTMRDAEPGAPDDDLVALLDGWLAAQTGRHSRRPVEPGS